MGVLEPQCRQDSDNDPNDEAAKKDEQESANGFKHFEGIQMVVYRVNVIGAGNVLLGGLVQDNGNRIVENRFPKDDRVELRVYFVGIENGKNSDGVRRGKCCPDSKGLDKGDAKAIERKLRPQVEDDAEHNGGDEGARKCKCQDAANVPKEVCLYRA